MLLFISSFMQVEMLLQSVQSIPRYTPLAINLVLFFLQVSCIIQVRLGTIIKVVCRRRRSIHSSNHFFRWGWSIQSGIDDNWSASNLIIIKSIQITLKILKISIKKQKYFINNCCFISNIVCHKIYLQGSILG